MLGFSTRYSLVTSKNRYLFGQYVSKRRPDLYKYLFLINDLIDLGNYKLLEEDFLSIEYSARNKKIYDGTESYEIDK